MTSMAMRMNKHTSCETKTKLFWSCLLLLGAACVQMAAAVCPLGNYNYNSGYYTYCYSCPRGRYADSQYLSSCRYCQAGQYQSYSGKSSCFSCSAGRYGTYTGATSALCFDCSAGQYQSYSGKSSCYSCSAGNYQYFPGQTHCAQCPAGQYQYYSGKSTCDYCSAGRYRATPGGTSSSSCSYCPAGRYAPSTRSSACSACSTGTYQPYSGRTNCYECQAGKYESGTGSALCTDCAAGNYQFRTGSTVCSSCAAGYYSQAVGASYCTQCAAGFFAPTPAQTSCMPVTRCTFPQRETRVPTPALDRNCTLTPDRFANITVVGAGQTPWSSIFQHSVLSLELANAHVRIVSVSMNGTGLHSMQQVFSNASQVMETADVPALAAGSAYGSCANVEHPEACTTTNMLASNGTQLAEFGRLGHAGATVNLNLAALPLCCNSSGCGTFALSSDHSWDGELATNIVPLPNATAAESVPFRAQVRWHLHPSSQVQVPAVASEYVQGLMLVRSQTQPSAMLGAPVGVQVGEPVVQQRYQVAISEHTHRHLSQNLSMDEVLILRLAVGDDHGMVSFALAGNASSYFSLSQTQNSSCWLQAPCTLDLLLHADMDHEQQPRMDLIVSMTDLHDQSLTMHLALNITDELDAPVPVPAGNITGPWSSISHVQESYTVQENSQPGVMVGALHIFDDEVNVGREVLRCHLQQQLTWRGEQLSLFDIDAVTCTIHVHAKVSPRPHHNESMDFARTAGSVLLTVAVTDSGVPSSTTLFNVSVDIVPVPEPARFLTTTVYLPEVPCKDSYLYSLTDVNGAQLSAQLGDSWLTTWHTSAVPVVLDNTTQHLLGLADTAGMTTALGWEVQHLTPQHMSLSVQPLQFSASPLVNELYPTWVDESRPNEWASVAPDSANSSLQAMDFAPEGDMVSPAMPGSVTSTSAWLQWSLVQNSASPHHWQPTVPDQTSCLNYENRHHHQWLATATTEDGLVTRATLTAQVLNVNDPHLVVVASDEGVGRAPQSMLPGDLVTGMALVVYDEDDEPLELLLRGSGGVATAFQPVVDGAGLGSQSSVVPPGSAQGGRPGVHITVNYTTVELLQGGAQVLTLSVRDQVGLGTFREDESPDPMIVIVRDANEDPGVHMPHHVYIRENAERGVLVQTAHSVDADLWQQAEFTSSAAALLDVKPLPSLQGSLACAFYDGAAYAGILQLLPQAPDTSCIQEETGQSYCNATLLIGSQQVDISGPFLTERLACNTSSAAYASGKVTGLVVYRGAQLHLAVDSLDYEALMTMHNNNTLTVTVTASDDATIQDGVRYTQDGTAPASGTASFVIHVLDVPDAPVVTSLHTVTPFGLTTAGGETLTLRGVNLWKVASAGVSADLGGPGGTVPVYGFMTSNHTQDTFFTAKCTVSRANEEVQCITPSGWGAEYSWMLMRGRLPTFEYSTRRVMQLLPHVMISARNSTSGRLLTSQLAKVALQLITVSVELDSNISLASPGCTQARHAAGPAIVTSADRSACISNASSAACEAVISAVACTLRWVSFTPWTTDVVHYAAPSLATVSTAAYDADTAGEDWVTLTGAQFGDNIEKLTVQYGGGLYEPFTATACNITVPHSELQCLTAPGFGAGLSWSVTVANLTSSSPITAYHRPIVHLAWVQPAVSGDVPPTPNFTAHARAAGAEGDWLFASGEYFSAEEYGAGFGVAVSMGTPAQRCGSGDTSFSGLALLATDCEVITRHTLVRCRMPTGEGIRHHVQVTIAGQASLLVCNATVSYALPVVYNASQPLSPASTGSLQLLGEHFGRGTLSSTQPVVQFGHCLPSDTTCIDRAQHMAALYDKIMPTRLPHLNMSLWPRFLNGSDVTYVSNLQLSARVPPGLGSAVPVRVAVAGNMGPAVYLGRYAEPVMTTLELEQGSELHLPLQFRADVASYGYCCEAWWQAWRAAGGASTVQLSSDCECTAMFEDLDARAAQLASSSEPTQPAVEPQLPAYATSMDIAGPGTCTVTAITAVSIWCFTRELQGAIQVQVGGQASASEPFVWHLQIPVGVTLPPVTAPSDVTIQRDLDDQTVVTARWAFQASEIQSRWPQRFVLAVGATHRPVAQAAQLYAAGNETAAQQLNVTFATLQQAVTSKGRSRLELVVRGVPLSPIVAAVVAVTSGTQTSPVSELSSPVPQVCTDQQYLSTQLQQGPDQTNVLCQPCPHGAICSHGNRTWQDIVNQPGYWRVTWSPYGMQFAACDIPQRCPGEQTSAALQQWQAQVLNASASLDGTANVTAPDALAMPAVGCAPGQTGVKCSACLPQHSQGPDGLCEPCQATREGVAAFMALGVAVIFAMLAVMIRSTVRTGRQSGQKQASHMGYAKLLVAHVQVISLASTFQFQWPSEVLTMFTLSESATSASSSLVRPECVAAAATSSLHQRLRFQLFGPVLVWAVFALWFFARAARKVSKESGTLLFRIRSHLGCHPKAAGTIASPLSTTVAAAAGQKATPKSKAAEYWRTAARRALVAFLVVGFFFHLSTTRIGLMALTCVTLAGRGVLLTEPNTPCTPDTGEWRWSYGYASLLGYGFMLPVTSVAMLYAVRHKRHEKVVKEALGFLFANYQESSGRYMWEPVEQSKRLLLCLIAVSAAPYGSTIQFFLSSLVLGAHLGAVAMLKPYWAPPMNVAAFACGAVAQFTLMVGTLTNSVASLASGDAATTARDAGLIVAAASWVAVVMNLILVLGLVGMIMFVLAQNKKEQLVQVSRRLSTAVRRMSSKPAKVTMYESPLKRGGQLRRRSSKLPARKASSEDSGSDCNPACLPTPRDVEYLDYFGSAPFAGASPRTNPLHQARTLGAASARRGKAARGNTKSTAKAAPAAPPVHLRAKQPPPPPLLPLATTVGEWASSSARASPNAKPVAVNSQSKSVAVDHLSFAFAPDQASRSEPASSQAVSNPLERGDDKLAGLAGQASKLQQRRVSMQPKSLGPMQARRGRAGGKR